MVVVRNCYSSRAHSQPASTPAQQAPDSSELDALASQQLLAEAKQANLQRHKAGHSQQQVPVQPGPPKPEAIALAKFLQSQNLKTRTCIFQDQRKDMFKVKRAIRALHSEAYAKARKKNPLLPEVTDRVTAENTFKLLPMSLPGCI